jgi:hypothetical protein
MDTGCWDKRFDYKRKYREINRVITQYFNTSNKAKLWAPTRKKGSQPGEDERTSIYNAAETTTERLQTSGRDSQSTNEGYISMLPS